MKLAVALLLGVAPWGSTWSAGEVPPSSGPAAAPTLNEPSPALRVANTLRVPVGGSQEAALLPIYFEADRLEGSPDKQMKASGAVRLTRGDLVLRADELTHLQPDNSAQATGNVRVTRGGDLFTGPAVQLKLDTLEGEFTSPTYRFARTEAGGQAEKIEFLGPQRLRAVQATYSSCTPENTQAPDWVLQTSSVTLDQEKAEGRAENAVVKFMGVPILAAPVLTFPLNDARKSGFLPPSIDVDSKSGVEYSQPYYLNLAPERDATLTPTLSTRRGLGMDAEYRYLMPHDRGTLRGSALPDDRLADRSRGHMDLQHQGSNAGSDLTRLTQYDLRWRRVSDNDYWKDFPRSLNNMTLTPRLLESHGAVEQQLNTRAWGLGPNQAQLYARVQTWQTLQDLDPSSDSSSRISTPYRREPQLGLRSRSMADNGWVWGLDAEFNRFTNEDTTRVTGNRVHAVARVERSFGTSAWYLTPRLSLNAASYTLDTNTALGANPRQLERSIPTGSLDAGLVFERDSQWFGQRFVQTLEPRALYVRTPYRRQSNIPLFDSAPRDFNPYSIFSENAFTGVDRVADANLMTLGVTTRLIHPGTGAEAMRLAVVQKVQFSDQRITPNDGAPITQRLSDLLLQGSTTVIPRLSLDTTLQYNAQDSHIERSASGVRFNGGPWRTLALSHLYSRNSSEQIDLSWQWPLSGKTPAVDAQDRTRADQASCKGAWYSVGRLSYSMQDKRLSNGLLGFEYDGGCWIGRIVADRSALGTANTTRMLFQLELIGLSRVGTSALRTLTSNIGGYRPLRDDSATLIPEPDSGAPAYDD